MKSYIVPLVLALVPTVAVAQDADSVDADCCIFSARVAENTITVTASGQRGKVSDTGQPVTVITASEIDRIGGADPIRLLERAPGVVISRNGGLGNFTGVRVRGAESEQLLVLIDGVRVGDAASPGGGFDFGNLAPGTLGKIELLRGSNSVVWGSQAIGGVLAITSREVEGLEVSAERGANDTWYGVASAGVKQDYFSAGITASLLDTGGVSSAAIGSEDDGYRQVQVSGRTRYDLGNGLTLTANGRYARSKLDLDGFPPPTYLVFSDTAEFQRTNEKSGRIGAEYVSGDIRLNGGYALSDTRRGLFDPTFGPASYYTTRGRTERAEMKGQWSLPADLRLDFGAEREWSRFSSTYDAQAKTRQTGVHALLGLYRGDRGNLSAGLRLDDHARFGTHWTMGVNGNVMLADSLRLRASYGEGFKAPTLFQLLSNYGNAALAPETSRSIDAGLERNFAHGRVAITLFRRDSRDLIAFVSCFMISTGICAGRPDGTYDNIGRARAQGFELEGMVRPADGFTLSAAYSYVKSVNRTPGSANQGNDLARRPRHALTLSADWTLDHASLFATTLGADVRMVGDSYDDAGNFTRLDGYPLLTLRASRPILLLDASSQRTLDVYARIENVFAEHYQTAAGYGTAGRAAFVGVRAKF